jgi:hypothetical protein
MKLPVFKAIGMTFAFVVSNWLDILKIVWLPIVLLIGAYALIMPGYMASFAGFMQTGSQPSPEEAAQIFGSVLPLAFGLLLVSMAFNMIVFAGILKLVIRGEKPSLPFYIGFGGDEWRLLATWVLVFLIFFGAQIAFALVTGVVTFALGAAGAIVALVLMLVYFVGLIWMCVRLSLATAATVGASTIGIGPSWSASKGNAWRLFFYWFIWGIIFAILYVAIILILMPDYFTQLGQVMAAAQGGSVQEIEAASNAMTASAMSIYDFSSPAGIAALAIVTVLGVIGTAFWIVSGGVAWRLLTDDQPEKHFE